MLPEILVGNVTSMIIGRYAPESARCMHENRMNSMKTPVQRLTNLLPLASVIVMLGFGVQAMGALGGDVSSVEADRVHIKGSVEVTQAEAYSVHLMKAPEGTIVKEYVSPAGRVFAVAWHGAFVPDMQQILGTYFQQYSVALQTQPKRYGRRPLNIQQSGLIVQASGRMRAYWGRAYIPEMLPKGVTADEIK